MKISCWQCDCLPAALLSAARRPACAAGEGSTFIKWCCLLINTASLELQGDYTSCAWRCTATSQWLGCRLLLCSVRARCCLAEHASLRRHGA